MQRYAPVGYRRVFIRFRGRPKTCRRLEEKEEDMRRYGYGMLFVAFAAIAICVNPASASFFDIYANDDTFVRTGSGTNFDNQGLFVKRSTERDLYLEFTLGSEAVTEAKLKVYQTQAICDGQWINWKGEEWSFDETTLNWNNQANANPWYVLPTFTTLVNTMQWYEIDVTSFYNDHLGKTISFFAWSRSQTTDQYGNTFEDREGSKGTTYYPRISGDTVPEPASGLLMLATGLFGLPNVIVRRRR